MKGAVHLIEIFGDARSIFGASADQLIQEAELLRAEKPVVVSMGSYATSGGYYIAAPADVIVANRTTLTGSIGVFGLYINTFDAMKNKLGITVDGVKNSAQAGAGTSGPSFNC